MTYRCRATGVGQAWIYCPTGALLRRVEAKCYRLPDAQVKWLEEESARLGLSESEVVRRAIDEYRSRHERERERRRT